MAITFKVRCGICSTKVDRDECDAIVYRASDRRELQEMRVCKKCGDGVESGALKPEDFDE